MARFVVFERLDKDGYLLDLQSDLFRHLNTRVVAPLVPEREAPRRVMILNPLFLVKSQPVVMLTQFLSAVSVKELGPRCGNLGDNHSEIMNALDLLLTGV